MARAVQLLRDVAADLRAAGVPVQFVDGWETRGREDFDPRGIICHDTGGSATSTDSGEISTLLRGSTSAPAPIAQIFLSRTTGVWIVAAGRCNHALTGRAGPLKGLGNTNLLGIEAAANPGRAWPAQQYLWYVLLVAALCRRRGWSAVWNVAAHREHQPGEKIDPQGIDMGLFRAGVQEAIGGGVTVTSTGGDFDMIKVVAVARADQVHYLGLIAGGRPVPIATNADLERWRALARAALQPTDLSIPADLYDAAFPAVAVPQIPGGEQLAQVVAAAVDSRIPAIAEQAARTAGAKLAAASEGT